MFEMKKGPKPAWLKARIPGGQEYFRLKKELTAKNLHTICQSARCPNICQCWNDSQATFLVMGNTCTRDCLFCSVQGGRPAPLDEAEGENILDMIDIMNARYIVITSVTRDDLEDGGSRHFAELVKTIKARKPGLKVEVLIPDFQGQQRFLENIFQARPDVIGHNLETVRGLYPKVNRRPNHYDISLSVLKMSKEKGFITKSGFMLGLGETDGEVIELLADLENQGTDLLTIGQYLQPTAKNLPVDRYYTPEEFTQLRDLALTYGFAAVKAGPFVRSSFQAEEMVRQYLDRLAGDEQPAMSG